MNIIIIYMRNIFSPKGVLFGKNVIILNTLMFFICLFSFTGCDDSEEPYTAPLLPLISADYDFDQFGGNGTIVTEETTSVISASCEQDWITALTVNGTIITFTVNRNISISSRVAQIILKSGNISSTVIIMQSSAMFTNEDKYIINSEEGERLLEMATELEHSIIVDPAATWITSFQIVDEGLKLNVEASPSIQSRSATFTLVSAEGRASKTFTVTQQGYDFGIFPEKVDFTIQGGSQNIIVSGSRNYIVTFEALWLTFEKTSEGGVFTAASNENGDERIALVTFTDTKYGATKTFTVSQDPDPAEYQDYLGDWEITAYNGNKYTVTLSAKVEGQSFNMTSESWPGLTIECKWSTANYGRRLTIYTQLLATNPDGSLLLLMPAYTSSSGGASFNASIGVSAAYFKFDGISTITCNGGTSTAYDGFIIYNRDATNTANVGWYSGGPNRFTGTILTKK